MPDHGLFIRALLFPKRTLFKNGGVPIDIAGR
jgi:hypothetical protein